MAVAAGLLLTVVFHLKSSASDVTVREIIRLKDARFAESKPPARLLSNAVIVLDVDGSLFFAGARSRTRCRVRAARYAPSWSYAFVDIPASAQH
jgi:MFS superfamily sulfate permease-like transporter